MRKPILRGRSPSSRRSRPADRRTRWRGFAGPLQASLGQPIVIENVGGAGGTVGVTRVARAEPDGYTLLIGQWSTQVVNPVTYYLAVDVVNDFAPIALLADTPQIIIARKDFPAKDVRELIAWLKANPDKAQAATVGAAGGAQVAGMYFEQVTGTRFGFVPYRGGAPAMQDLMAGRVDFMFDQAANAMTQLRAGTIKAYAVMTEERWHLAPDIPTIDESGVSRLHISYWHALFAPKGTPQDIITKVNAAVVSALGDPVVKGALPRLARISGRGATNAAGACRPVQGRDREVVADHLGRAFARGVVASRF